MSKQLTDEAADLLVDEGLEFFTNINEYVAYLFSETNFHDGMIMLKALDNKIDGYILTQDEFYFIANKDNIYLDIEEYFDSLEFEGEVFEW